MKNVFESVTTKQIDYVFKLGFEYNIDITGSANNLYFDESQLDSFFIFSTKYLDLFTDRHNNKLK